MRGLRALVAIATLVGLALVAPADASGQTVSDSSKPTVPAIHDRLIVELAPSPPRQGAMLRIIVRTTQPRLTDGAVGRRPDTTTRATTDTSARAAAWTTPVTATPRPDSTATLAAPTDTTASDSTPGRILSVRGTLFGEPLHFTQADSATYLAIGGIPVDAPRTVQLPLILDRAGMLLDTVFVRVEIARTDYRMEKLTVAPRFGQAPDSALAARIAREQALAAAVSRGSHATPRMWTGAFERPRPSRVTSRFGDGREFNGAVQSRHMGLDLAGAVGAPVLAPDRGVVALVGEFYYAGNAVYIDHGAGLVTAYFHLSAVNVAKGDTVAAGDTIGKVGATGRVTGPHLHWVARYGSVTVDPSSLLELGPARREP